MKEVFHYAENLLKKESNELRKRRLKDLIFKKFKGFSPKKVKKLEQNLFKLLHSNKFVMYGAGGGGVLFFEFFCKKYELYPIYVIDKLEKYDENKMYFWENLSQSKILKVSSDKFKKLPKDFICVITISKKELQDQVKTFLRTFGFKNIISVPEELLLYFEYRLVKKDAWEFGYTHLWKYFVNLKSIKKLLKNKKEVLEVFNLLADEKSKEVFYHILKDFLFLKNGTPYDSLDKQYFPEEIKLKKGYKVFIDCGSWKGDTIRKLMDFYGKVKTLICFEPNLDCFKFLCKFINIYKNQIAENILLYPCGVYSKEMTFKFKKDWSGSASYVCEKGNELITCVSLDKALAKFKPTFIKMDIEGAELEALKGAKRIIKEYKPDLAICVYHKPEHLWEIPLYLKKLVPEYKLYLRKYGDQFITETVLYTTI